MDFECPLTHSTKADVTALVSVSDKQPGVGEGYYDLHCFC